MSRRRGLGSGLDALIPGGGGPAAQSVRQIDIDSIQANRSQPRTHFDEQALEELAASIREHGVIQPLIVSADAAGSYELIAGERRLRAARRAGLREVPALIKNATPQQLLELALVENVQRADLNPLEEGLAYQTLKDEFGLSDEDIARRVSKSRVAVVNSRRLIKLGDPARQALLDGAISAGHGRALLRFEAEDEQRTALDLLIRRGLNVRDAERLAELVHQQQLIPEVRHALLSGLLSLTQAQSLLRVEDALQQRATVDLVLSQGLSTRETDRLCDLVVEGVSPSVALAQVRGIDLSPKPSPTTRANVEPGLPGNTERPARPQSAEDTEIQRLFEEILGTPVQLSRSGSSIRLTITFYSDEQLQGLYDMLGGS